MTDIKLREDSDRGILAQQVLNNPVYQEGMLLIRAELLNLFEQTKFRDKEERDEIWRKLKVVGWFESHLQKVMQTGKLADQSLVEKVKTRFSR